MPELGVGARLLTSLAPVLLVLGCAGATTDGGPPAATVAAPIGAPRAEISPAPEAGEISAVAPASGLAVDPTAIPIGSAAFDDQVLRPRPVRLVVDAMELDAEIIDVGIVDGTGEMELPGARDVAWYRYGAVPGSPTGSSVLAAHVDWNGKVGPFFGLREVAVGERILVELDDGTTVHYRVERTMRFAKDELPDDLFRKAGPHTLAMVTCGGSFDERSRSYADNVAVLAVPVSAPAAGGDVS